MSVSFFRYLATLTKWRPDGAPLAVPSQMTSYIDPLLIGRRLRTNSQRNLGSHLILFTVSVLQRKTLVTWLRVSLAVGGPTVSALV